MKNSEKIMNKIIEKEEKIKYINKILSTNEGNSEYINEYIKRMNESKNELEREVKELNERYLDELSKEEN